MKKKKISKILILWFLDRSHSVSVDIEGKEAKPPHSMAALKNIKFPMKCGLSLVSILQHMEYVVQSISTTRANLGTSFSFLHPRRSTFPHHFLQQEKLLQKLLKDFSPLLSKLWDNLANIFSQLFPCLRK